MWSIVSRHWKSTTSSVTTRSRLAVRAAKISPRMRPRNQAIAPAGWILTQTSPYYYDASRQTAKSVRAAMAQSSNPGLLTQTIESLLLSICPGHSDDHQSRKHFETLLHVHLSAFDSASLTQLISALKKANFACYVTEGLIDDQSYLDYGFANGPPHKRYRTLLQTADFFNLLECSLDTALQIDQAANSCATLKPGWPQAAREALANCADEWTHGERSIKLIYFSACQLAASLGLVTLPDAVVTGQLASRASTLEWQGETLRLAPEIAAQCLQAQGASVFATLMRDLLELMLMKSLFGPSAQLTSLNLSQQRMLRYAVEQVIEHCQPVCTHATLRKKAAALMANAQHFGQIQVLPGCGGALGHAWIAPHLSLIPDRTQEGMLIGSRFMQTGFQTQPDDVAIREWATQFLTAHQNEELYPAVRTVHVKVPVAAERLQEAARMTVKTWRENNLPYRFIGTVPGMPATGCRAVVWHAVQLGMDDDARTLFEFFNRGLPDPDSPTELWLRFAGLMGWLQALARDDAAAL